MSRNRYFVVALAWLAASSAFCPAQMADGLVLPDWWQGSQSPEVRELGEQLAGRTEPNQRSLGNLMLARHQETLGNLPRALYHVDLALESEGEDLTNVMASCLRAEMLGRMGRLEDEREAIEQYEQVCKRLGGRPIGLRDPVLMMVYNLAAAGESQKAREKLSSLGPAHDSDQLAERYFAEAILASSSDRDPSSAWSEIEDAFGKLGGAAVMKNFQLLNAASIYAARIFDLQQAEELAVAAMKVRPDNTVFLPEAEIARYDLEACQWEKAADWLSKAQQAKMVLRPNYRQEAIKDLKFAVADFYLATGYPREARLSLEGLENDFFRPGYTTGSDEYYLCGLYLRRWLALNRELELAVDCWLRSDFKSKIRSLLPLGRLQLSLWQAKMQFRDNLLRRIANATPGTDIATLYYGPTWLLPALREILGKGNFAALAGQFPPEGIRADVLNPMISALAGHKIEAPHKATPTLLRAIILALVGPSEDVATAVYRDAPSAFLLAGRPLPIKTAANFPVSGWMQVSDKGLALSVRSSADASSAIVDIGTGGAALLRSCQTGWPKSAAGQLEKLNVAASTSVFPLAEQMVKKLEGKALNFQTGEVAAN